MWGRGEKTIRVMEKGGVGVKERGEVFFGQVE